MDDKYKNRCLNRLKEWNAPTGGWMCVEIIDVMESANKPLVCCELCDCPKVRYIHMMRNDRYFEDVAVGCICAGILEGDILAAYNRERLLKNRNRRKQTFIRRKWQELLPRGNYRLKYRGDWVKIFEGKDSYRVYYGHLSTSMYKGEAITNFLSAIYAAFDLIDPIAEVYRA